MLRRVLLLVAFTATALLAGLPSGRPLTDVPIQRPTGKPIDLKQYRGKPLVIALISTGCEDCAKTVELLKKVQSENPGLEVVGAVIEPNAANNVAGFVKKHSPIFPIGYVELEDYRKLANVKDGQNVKIPILLFVDPKHMVRVQFFGDEPMLEKEPGLIVRSTVRELMKEAAPAATASGK